MLPAALALADTDLDPLGSESDTVGKCGGGSAVPGIVRDESGWVAVGVDAKMSLYEMNDNRL